MDCNRWTRDDKMKYLTEMAAKLAEDQPPPESPVATVKKPVGYNKWSPGDKNKYLLTMAAGVTDDTLQPSSPTQRRSERRSKQSSSPRNQSPLRAIKNRTKVVKKTKKPKKMPTVTELQQDMNHYTTLIETVIGKVTETQERLMEQFKVVLEATHVTSPQIRSSNAFAALGSVDDNSTFSHTQEEGLNTTLPCFTDSPIAHRDINSGTPADAFQSEDLPEDHMLARQQAQNIFTAKHPYYCPSYYIQVRPTANDDFPQYPVC